MFQSVDSLDLATECESYWSWHMEFCILAVDLTQLTCDAECGINPIVTVPRPSDAI